VPLLRRSGLSQSVIGAKLCSKERVAAPSNLKTMEQIATDQIVRALHKVLDPEVGVNVIDLGLVYGIESN
jgi:hypothetical protein